MYVFAHRAVERELLQEFENRGRSASAARRIAGCGKTFSLTTQLGMRRF